MSLRHSRERPELLAAAANIVNDTLTAKIVERLRMAGVRAIVLKGPSVRSWLYGDDSASRVSADIDLLVQGSELEAARPALTSFDLEYLGVTTVGRGRPRRGLWRDPATALLVELHTNLVGIGAADAAAWAVLSAATEDFVLDAGHVEILGPRARTMHVALHAAQHGRQFQQPLDDLERALARLPRTLWEQAVTLADELDALPAFAAGLRLVPPGAALADELGLPTEVPPDVALRADTPPAVAQGLDWLLSLEGVRAKAAFIARVLAPPREYIRTWSPLARRGPLGLAAAYAWRPFWLAWRLPTATAAVIRARAKATRSG